MIFKVNLLFAKVFSFDFRHSKIFQALLNPQIAEGKKRKATFVGQLFQIYHILSIMEMKNIFSIVILFVHIIHSITFDKKNEKEKKN